MKISKLIPRECWIVLITLNSVLFCFSAYMGEVQDMALNLVSALACYLAMRINSILE